MVAEKMKGVQSPHICPFHPETIRALIALGSFYSKSEKAFKTFIVGLVVLGAIILMFTGLRNQIRAFISTL